MSRRKNRPAEKPGPQVESRASANLGAARGPSPHAGSAQPASAPILANWLVPLFLVPIGVAAYLSSFAGAFLFDDNLWIVNSPVIRVLWPPWIPMGQTSRPVMQLSLAVNYALGGMNPLGYHAVNLAIHVLAGLLLFGIVRRMLESNRLRARYGRASRWLALAVAGIWLVHPLQTQAVTYVIQRAESLVGLFYLLTLYCFIRARQSPHPRRWDIAAVVACALGMGSKEVMVTAPILILVYDRVFVAGSYRDALRERWGLYAGLAATWLILVAALANRAPSEAQVYLIAGLSPVNYLLTQGEVILHYLRLSLWPDPLIIDYYWPIAERWSTILPGLAVMLVLLGGTIVALHKRMWVGFWGAWFFLILAPTSSVMPIADVAFEHRMYLPLAAVVAVLVVGGHDLFVRLANRLQIPGSARMLLEGVLGGAIIVTLAFVTGHRNDDYRSPLVMWNDTVVKRPSNPRAHFNLGIVLAQEGRAGEAKAHYVEAIRLKPDYVDARNNLASALLSEGRYDEAAAQLTEALRIDPTNAESHQNLGATLGSQGKLAESIVEFNEAIRLKPNFAKAHVNLGLALDSQGKLGEAIVQYKEALRLDPNDAEAYNNYGSALVGQRKLPEAVTQFNEALRLKPNYAGAHNNLGAALLQLGRVKEAATHFAEAVRLDPTMVEARRNLDAHNDRR